VYIVRVHQRSVYVEHHDLRFHLLNLLIVIVCALEYIHMENLGNLQAQTSLSEVGYEALTNGAALVDRSHRILLRLAGKNSTEMLNAILTNVVPEEDNLGAYAALLNPKGRIQTDLRVLKADGEVFVDAEPEGA